MQHQRRFHPLAAAGLLAFGFTATADPVSIQVLSATVRDQGVGGAEVLLQENGQQTAHGFSDANGDFHGTSAFSADDPAATLIIRKEGYSTLVAKCPCNKLSYAISPVMQELDGLRVVLNWGQSPLDLDAHLVYSTGHIYWNAKDGDEATLDVDQQHGYGPETVTIRERRPGQRYVYAVHNYIDRTLSGSSSMELGRPQVRVYVGQTLVRSYEIDPNRSGNLWTVFAITEDGTFEDLNQYSDVASPDNVASAEASNLAGSLNPTLPAVSATDRQRALASNRNGESAYARRDYESAISLFQQAIQFDPGYGQAYSNLGLSFQKAGNQAEAIWADRKALSLASGPDAPQIRASTWYNIGRIYEAKSEWAKALSSYQAARYQRYSDIYSQAIDRMQQKLQGR